MTALQLLVYICVALLIQLTLGIGVAVWCRRRAAEELSIAMPGESPAVAKRAWSGWREFRVVRREFEDNSRTQCSFYLAPVDGAPLPPFKPGQFLTFSLTIADPGSGTKAVSRKIVRCYSLSDRPEASSYRITIKRVPAPVNRPDIPPGAASSYFHDNIHERDVLTVKAPAGQFFLDSDPKLPAAFIAGGIGITPMISMLRWCLAEQPGRPVYLYYGVRQRADHAFKQVLEQLLRSHPNFHLHIAYSQPGPEDVQGRDFQHTGHINVDLLKRSLPHGRHQFYVCGPPPMMKCIIPALIHWGVLPTDIHHESFGAASAQNAMGLSEDTPSIRAAPINVRFRRSGRTLSWDGQDSNLLDFAERFGVEVESGCRTGSCGSCETELVSGTVRYALKPDHEVAPGHCLLCVGTPESALVLEA